MNKFENILEQIGGYGRYQILIHVWYSTMPLLVAPAFGFMIFGGIPPVCHDVSRNLTNIDLLGTPDSFNETNRTEQCQEQFDSVVMYFKLTGSRKAIGATITALQMVGTMIGPIIFGFTSDRWGRKSTYLVIVTSLAICQIIGGFTRLWQLHATVRFFIGVFSGGAMTVSGVLGCESVLSKHRALLVFPGWSTGFMFLAVLSMLAGNWQTLSFMSTAAYPIVLFLTLLVHESPKWLSERRRHDEARLILVKIARFNARGVKNIGELYAENVELVMKHELVDECCADSPSKYYYLTVIVILDFVILAVTISSFTYLDLFYNKTASIQCLVLMLCWFTTGCIFYMLNFNMAAISGTVAVNLVYISLIRVFLQAIIPMMDKYLPWFGRKGMLSVGLVAMAVGLTQKLLSKSFDMNNRNDLVNTIGSFTGITLGGFCWAAIMLFGAEIFPTSIRTMGMAAGNMAARFGAAICPYIPLLGEYWDPLPYLLTLAWVLFCTLLAMYFLPETKKKPLPDLPVGYRRKTLKDIFKPGCRSW